MNIIDPFDGEVRPMKLFVAAMGTSSYVFAQARPSERSPTRSARTWTCSLSSAARRSSWSATISGPRSPTRPLRAGLNRSYLEFADHYGVAILPARPYKSRDKAKVEQSVLIAERWILARLRDQRFFSAADLNVTIAEHVSDVNVRVMKGYDASRVELFTAIDGRR